MTERPDPDELLSRIQRDEARQQRGKLKIFFGASAGVGKTYAMLQAAHRLADEGLDVVAGVVETHGRRETIALLSGLEVLPAAYFEQRGRRLAEFDLDAALARRPALILIDELAHSNVAGARHAKRWQDVQELLDAGIDVYTTVNVQHLETLNDIVGQITGIRVWETVPDRIFDLADEVTLVDLPPEELLERLRDGKVYMPAQAERAIENFFRKGNLIALRELALRRTADRVDAQMREYRADQSIERLWRARERLIVCVGPGPDSAAMVRTASRLASSLKADWLAVYVDTPRLHRLADVERKPTFEALKLAGELGAETVVLDGANAAESLAAYALMRNVSKVLVGKSSRGRLRALLQPPFAACLAQAAPQVELTLIAPSSDVRHADKRARRPLLRRGESSGDPRSPLSAYVIATIIAAAITAVVTLSLSQANLSNLVMLYLLGVVFAAVKLGRGPGAYLSFLSVFLFDFFCVDPRFSFAIADTQYLLTFVVMLTTSLTISHLTSSLRRQARAASARERRTAAMYAMVKELGAALTEGQIIEIATRHTHEVFGARVAVLLPDSEDQVRQKIDHPDPMTALPEESLAIDVAQWVYDRQQPAGAGTNTLPASTAYYLPLKAPMRTRGVMALVSNRNTQWASPEQNRLLETFASQIALALERVHYVEIAQDALVSMESERLRNSLLATISHDLRTPLTAILGLAATLAAQLRESTSSRNDQGIDLANTIHGEAQHMVSLVSNLLDMARLQGGVKLDLQWLMLEEAVGAALALCRRILDGRPVTVTIAPDVPMIRLDAVLMERVFVNLFENVCKYATPGTTIGIVGTVVHDGARRFVKVAVNDIGPGLVPGTEGKIFDKFTRGVKESATRGVGLGLAICRAIVEAHGGQMQARNRISATGERIGASFSLTLPADVQPPAIEEMGEDDMRDEECSGRLIAADAKRGDGEHE
ncbi:sensor histidine kinase [Robbsia andropogonis]|uniref:sensor histidine kinase n=1 Tax=Robbsia andropogonis TaxID=28092 RepID=UPI00046794DC|nr:sensor histidine kinase KdpD [Robbsia andropogonis]